MGTSLWGCFSAAWVFQEMNLMFFIFFEEHRQAMNSWTLSLWEMVNNLIRDSDNFFYNSNTSALVCVESLVTGLQIVFPESSRLMHTNPWWEAIWNSNTDNGLVITMMLASYSVLGTQYSVLWCRLMARLSQNQKLFVASGVWSDQGGGTWG